MSTAEQEFAERFADAWARPTVERLAALLHPEVVLYQPHLPTIRGQAAARAEFERLLRWLPELFGTVRRSCGSHGIVFIEWQMVFPIGRRGVSIAAVDRFVLQNGLGIERAVYFSPLPLLKAVLTHPSSWAGFGAYRSGR